MLLNRSTRTRWPSYSSDIPPMVRRSSGGIQRDRPSIALEKRSKVNHTRIATNEKCPCIKLILVERTGILYPVYYNALLASSIKCAYILYFEGPSNKARVQNKTTKFSPVILKIPPQKLQKGFPNSVHVHRSAPATDPNQPNHTLTDYRTSSRLSCQASTINETHIKFSTRRL